jgi:PAS domain S-box-containing protein
MKYFVDQNYLTSQKYVLSMVLKRADGALDESEDKFRQLFTQMPSAVAIYDAVDNGEDFIFKDFNTAAEKIEGIKKDDLIGKRVTQVFPGVKAFGIFAVFQRVWRTGQPEIFPSALYRDERDPGTWRENWVFKLVSGEVIAIYHDITERMRVEEALRESEEKYRLLSESSPDHVIVQDLDLRYVYILHPQLGLKLGDMLGKTDYDFLEKEDANKLTQIKQDVIRTGTAAKYETSLMSKNGENEYFEGTYVPKYDKKGKIDGLMGYFRNITERKRVEEALAQSEYRYRTLAESAQDVIFIINQDFLFTFVNSFGAVQAGKTPEEFIGMPLQALFPPQTFDKMNAILHEVFEKGKPQRVEIEIPLLSSHLWHDSYIVPMQDKEGNISSLLGISRDITERKKAEEQLKRFSEELEMQVAVRTEALNKSLHEKEILIKEVHHRVKNNMQIITSLLNLQARTIDDPVVLKTIKDSQSRIKAMALVHERLYRSGDISSINLKDYIQFLAKELFSFYGIKPQHIRFTINAPAIKVNIDTAIPLGLIVNELISNAIKYAFPMERKGEIVIDITKDKNKISLVVRDNGVGIPADFDWRNAKSLGLRLIISLVEQLLGTIELDRSTGTVFTIVVKEKE